MLLVSLYGFFPQLLSDFLKKVNFSPPILPPLLTELGNIDNQFVIDFQEEWLLVISGTHQREM